MDLVLKIATYAALVIAAASTVALALRAALPPLKEYAESTETAVDNKVVKVLGYFVSAAVWLGDFVLPLLNRVALNPKDSSDA